jgi:hypothetical protein
MNMPFGRIELILDTDVHQADEESQLQSIYEDVMNTELLSFE